MAEDQHIGAESPSAEERAREEVDRVLRLLEDGDRVEAVAMLKELHPVDQGEVLLELDQAVLSELSVEEIVQILERLDPDESSEIAAGIDSRALAVILDRTRSDMAADILRHLPADRARETLAAMTEADEIAPLLGYSDETAGGLMVLDYPVVSDYMTAGIALDVLRLLGRRAEEFGAIFVVDAEGGLLGYITVTRLALSPTEETVRDIMRPEIVSVPAETDQEECARLMERYDLRHLPVVDPEHKLIGIIQVENVVHVMEEEATEDMFRMAGLAGERVLSSLGNSVRSRLPWLTTNLGTVFLAALVINLFESTIAKVAVLAVFLPVVAGQGGHSRHSDAHAGGAKHGPGRDQQAQRNPAHRARASAGPGPRPAAGCGGRGGRLLLERFHHAGCDSGRGDAGQHVGGGPGRKQRASAAEAVRDGPGGVLGSLRDHLYGRAGVPDIPGHGRAAY